MADLPTSASFPIEHAQLRIYASVEDGATFVLATEDGGIGRSRPPLFSGLVGPQMADQLRAAADHAIGSLPRWRHRTGRAANDRA